MYFWFWGEHFKAANKADRLCVLLTLPAPSPPACASSPSGRHRNVTALFSAASSRCQRWSLVRTAAHGASLCICQAVWGQCAVQTLKTKQKRTASVREAHVVTMHLLTSGCSRPRCLQKRPTQTQTSCRSGGEFSGASWAHLGNAPVKIRYLI